MVAGLVPPLPVPPLPVAAAPGYSGERLAPGFAAIQALQRLVGGPAHLPVSLDPQGARTRIARLVAPFLPPMPGGVDLLPHPPAGPVGVLEFRPPHAALGRADPILYVHGGGLVVHGMATFTPILATLALQAGRPIIAFDYPKAPETAPATIVGALLAALDHVARRMTGPAAPTLAGDSIGGLVVLAAALSVLRDRRPGLVLAYPVLDITEHRTFASRARFGTRYMLDAETMAYFRTLARSAFPSGFDPLSPTAADAGALGPVTILGAGQDILADEAAMFGERLSDLGAAPHHTILPALPHDFLLFAGRIPEAADGLRRLAAHLA